MNPNDTALSRAEMPDDSRQDHSVINARSLQADHRRLAEVLRLGLRVLDVGCGAGAITRGVAEGTGAAGQAVGMDINAGLIEDARRRYGDVPGLSFMVGDIEKSARRREVRCRHGRTCTAMAGGSGRRAAPHGRRREAGRSGPRP